MPNFSRDIPSALDWSSGAEGQRALGAICEVLADEGILTDADFGHWPDLREAMHNCLVRWVNVECGAERLAIFQLNMHFTDRMQEIGCHEEGWCEGNYKLPDSLDPAQISGFEAAFFDTHFSHTNVDQRGLSLHPHGHNALWRDMVKTRRKEFPTEYLKPALNVKGQPMTLGKVIE